MGGIENAQHTHSMPLEIAQNHGIPAALILIFFVSLLLQRDGLLYLLRNIIRNQKLIKHG